MGGWLSHEAKTRTIVPPDTQRVEGTDTGHIRQNWEEDLSSPDVAGVLRQHHPPDEEVAYRILRHISTKRPPFSADCQPAVDSECTTTRVCNSLCISFWVTTFSIWVKDRLATIIQTRVKAKIRPSVSAPGTAFRLLYDNIYFKCAVILHWSVLLLVWCSQSALLMG